MKTKINNLYQNNRGNLRKIEKFTMNILIPILSTIFITVMILIAGTTKVEAKELNILENMNLPDCRLTQEQHDHIKKGNGSMYAYDIACIRGKTFDVYSPNYKTIYEVAYKGYDKRIGNYITIRHGDLFFIYGHTLSNLKVGDRLKNSVKIGKVDVSGISQNYHLHLELWKGTENIDFHYLIGEQKVVNKKSFKIREQRSWLSDLEINTEIEQFIEKFEGLETKAYWDIKHYSIGVGTPSYKGEVITVKQARKRARIVIQSIRDKYNLSKYSLDVQKAVVSFVYNIGSLNKDQKWLLENGYYSALGNNFKLYNGYYKDGKKIVLKGLVKRRSAEELLLKS